ncbi:MAG: hypothetical protein Q8M19_24490 [Reyranella sp.]|nr:hypothetical protein [Reyranella sp.]
MSDFDWYRDNAVVVREQPAIAIYRNVYGDITIRQKGEIDPEPLEVEDVVIVVLPQNARRLAEAILAVAAAIPAPGPLALPAPADRTAAERQRRHRAKRNGPCNRDTVTDTVTRRDTAELFEVRPPD